MAGNLTKEEKGIVSGMVKVSGGGEEVATAFADGR